MSKKLLENRYLEKAKNLLCTICFYFTFSWCWGWFLLLHTPKMRAPVSVLTGQKHCFFLSRKECFIVVVVCLFVFSTDLWYVISHTQNYIVVYILTFPGTSLFWVCVILSGKMNHYTAPHWNSLATLASYLKILLYIEILCDHLQKHYAFKATNRRNSM